MTNNEEIVVTSAAAILASFLTVDFVDFLLVRFRITSLSACYQFCLGSLYGAKERPVPQHKPLNFRQIIAVLGDY